MVRVRCRGPRRRLERGQLRRLAVGAHLYNGTWGRVYVYWGGPAVDDIPDLAIEALAAGISSASSRSCPRET